VLVAVAASQARPAAADASPPVAGERLTQTQASAATSYTYNSSGELTAADAPGGADDVAYAYDGDGRRTTETTGTSSPHPVL
jgi:YD repeat-containing protein